MTKLVSYTSMPYKLQAVGIINKISFNNSKATKLAVNYVVKYNISPIGNNDKDNIVYGTSKSHNSNIYIATNIIKAFLKNLNLINYTYSTPFYSTNKMLWGISSIKSSILSTSFFYSIRLYSKNKYLWGYSKGKSDTDRMTYSQTPYKFGNTTISSVSPSEPILPNNTLNQLLPSGSPSNKIIISEKNTYINLNNVSIVKLPERTKINVLSVKISTSIDSWAWGFNLSITDEESFNLLRPNATIKEFEITINDEIWIGVAEKYSISTVFGKKNWNITGRSLSAYLSEPYAATQNFTVTSAKTNQQLVDLLLENCGWIVDWKTSVYVVPANTYTINNKTPISAIIDIANSVGSVVNSDTNLKKLIVKPRFLNDPSKWGNNNSNIELSDSFLLSIDSSEYTYKKQYNKIYCIGRESGVIVGIKIIGSAGNVTAPQFTHDLITHVDAGREKARNYFDEIKNNREIFTISAPFIGKVRCGYIVKIIEESGNEWFSQVTDITVTISKGNIITHDLELERYYL